MPPCLCVTSLVSLFRPGTTCQFVTSDRRPSKRSHGKAVAPPRSWPPKKASTYSGTSEQVSMAGAVISISPLSGPRRRLRPPDFGCK